MTEHDESKGHIDIVGVIGGHQLFLGHADIDGAPYSHKRFREIATLLMSIAWQLEDEAEKYDGFEPRCFRTKLGDIFFEVAPDTFVEAEDRQEAEVLYLANTFTVNEETLRTYHPELEQVTE